MQNILVTAFGSVGDVLPFIGIGGELRTRGHAVTFIGNPYFEPEASRAGLSFSPVGTLDHFQKLMTDSELFHWKNAHERVFSHFVHVVEGAYEATMRLHRPGRTVLFGGPGCFGAQIAQERSRIPLAMGMVAPSRLPSRYDPPYPSWPLSPWAARVARTRTGLRFLHRLIVARSKLSRLRCSAVQIPPAAKPLLDEVNRVRASVGLPALGGSSKVRPPLRNASSACGQTGSLIDRRTGLQEP